MSIKTLEELEGMRRAGATVSRVIEAMREHVAPGVTTAELDSVGASVMRAHGARSAPALVYNFPGATCISVNDEAVHGVPRGRHLRDGDIVKLDVTIEQDGYMADAAVTVPVGARVREIGRAIEAEVRRSGFAVIRELGGHGIGRTMLTDGLVITIEPIIAAGLGKVRYAADGWTVTTTDGSASAHYEHTLVVTSSGPVLLTAA
jgi:methionyl aminopeptidase